MASSEDEKLPRFDSTKKGFDLEMVHDGFQKCMQPDGTLVMAEYLKSYRELNRIFKLMGRLFMFVAKDLEEKVSYIQKRSDSKVTGHHYDTMQSMIAFEVETNITHQRGRLPSGTRTLIRLQRTLEFIILFMQQLKDSPDDAKVSQIAWDVYKKTLSKYHMKIVRKMAYIAVHALPKRGQMFELLCKQEPREILGMLGKVIETEQSAYDRVNELLESNNLANIP